MNQSTGKMRSAKGIQCRHKTRAAAAEPEDTEVEDKAVVAESQESQLKGY